ncbi:hypothetical protein ASG90_05695 [Nocardioides sp. Soil797]|nr:hypothetical protein ASG90_05695 [Nocardioides sp. Soil797]
MVKIDPDEVYALGQDTIKFAETHLGKTEPLKDAKVSDATFGDIDSTVEFVKVHGAAQEVVKATLSGVHKDLTTFGQGLQAAVETLRATEDVTVSVFTALNVFRAPFGAVLPVADPQTDLDSTSLDDIGAIEDIDQADADRAAAIEAVRNEAGA